MVAVVTQDKQNIRKQFAIIFKNRQLRSPEIENKRQIKPNEQVKQTSRLKPKTKTKK